MGSGVSAEAEGGVKDKETSVVFAEAARQVPAKRHEGGVAKVVGLERYW